MVKTTQRERVLQYCMQYGSITRLEAATNLGCFELASRIGELEAEGHKFEKNRCQSRNRYGDTVRYTKYILVQ